ncbi:MAG: hypothetical protein JRI50_03540 [Deltaproteobacteria bacterium]|nr:hypothetical protein [Deltaproteobacteria bacterium]MBW2134335.1 hypothetical protein [Deltaproteobacteria bacterium]
MSSETDLMPSGQTLFTLGFSSHRIEALPYARQEMAGHQAIVLEEPPSETLAPMLAGQLPIADYIQEQGSEFPEYSYRQAVLLQEMHQAGKIILQIEPFLERLLQIHEMFALDQTPAEVLALPDLAPVYQMERQATRALLNFYTHSLKSSFGQVVEAVKSFARADAGRFRYRDELRAQALAALASQYKRIYVEAGYIHLGLPRALRRHLRNSGKVRSVFLLGSVVRPLLGTSRVLGPGDRLTLVYQFNAKCSAEKENLLAAQSLIHIKLLNQEEILAGESATPHTDDEIQANLLVNRLTFQDCERLYPLIRFANQAQALRQVQNYLRSQVRQ